MELAPLPDVPPARPSWGRVLSHWVGVATFAAAGLLGAVTAGFFTFEALGPMRSAPGFIGGITVVVGLLIAGGWVVVAACAWQVWWRVRAGVQKGTDAPLSGRSRFHRRARGLSLAVLCTPLALLDAVFLYILVDRLRAGAIRPGPGEWTDPAFLIFAGLGSFLFVLPLVGYARAAVLLFGRPGAGVDAPPV